MPGPTPEQIAAAGTEAAHQSALFCWAALPEQQVKYPKLKLLFHIPNGGTRDKREAGQLKAQGVKAGVPDLCLPVSVGRWHGVFIELKVKANKPGPEQIKWIDDLLEENYFVQVCYSWIDAAMVLCSYLNDEK